MDKFYPYKGEYIYLKILILDFPKNFPSHSILIRISFSWTFFTRSVEFNQ